MGESLTRQYFGMTKSFCKILVYFFIMKKNKIQPRQISVPAAAVRQKGLVLSIMIRCKRYVGGAHSTGSKFYKSL